jgi:hypothetical protein
VLVAIPALAPLPEPALVPEPAPLAAPALALVPHTHGSKPAPSWLQTW